MGPEVRPVDELVRNSGDPTFTAWFIKGRRRELFTEGEERPVTPRDFTAHIEWFWGSGWRERDRLIRQSLAHHDRLENDFLDAAYRPWRTVPPDPPPQEVE